MPDQALTLLRERGVKFSSVMLTAKEKICLNETMECDAEHCPYAKGHFDRVNDALFELITQEEKSGSGDHPGLCEKVSGLSF